MNQRIEQILNRSDDFGVGSVSRPGPGPNVEWLTGVLMQLDTTPKDCRGELAAAILERVQRPLRTVAHRWSTKASLILPEEPSGDAEADDRNEAVSVAYDSCASQLVQLLNAGELIPISDPRF